MAITMAMMEANFEGVGLSNTQQERVEELRAGLDSFSLTNIIAPEQDKTVFKNGRHHHDNHGYGSHRDTRLPDHQKQYGVDYHITRPSHDTGMQLMYRSQSYSNNPDHVGGYGDNVHNQRRGSELSHSDSFRAKRSNSYLQQQLDRRGSYLQQSKLSQSIKVITLILVANCVHDLNSWVVISLTWFELPTRDYNSTKCFDYFIVWNCGLTFCHHSLYFVSSVSQDWTIFCSS